MDPQRWQRIQEIFCAALEIDGPARDRFLDSACGDDPSLRHELDTFLRSATDDHDDLVAEAIRAEAASVLRPDAASEPAAVGPYQLIRRIGQGGMGAVYLAARADQQYDRHVAIKLLRSETGSRPELIRRFRTERQILAVLDHPNIAQLLDGGVTENGTPYLVMQYVDGVAIDDYCRAHALSVPDRIRLFRKVCSAVQYAHRSLVVHRDIKPSNILVAADGVPKLLDFGIAKLLQPGNMPHTVAMTRPAERLMTLEYASPEQIRGEAITTATDVYALGLVLYELLTGRRPFGAATSDAITLARTVCETDPRRPSAAASDAGVAFAGELRGDLDEIVLKAIRKEPEARYSSVEQLSEDLGRHLDGFPVTASRGTRRYRMSKFVRRHRLGVAAAAAFVLLLAVFGVTMSVLAARVARERDIAQVERTRSEKVSEFLIGLFSSSDPFHRSGKNVTARELLDSGSGRIALELGGEPEVRADLLETMAQAYQHLGDFDRSAGLFREEIQALDQAHGRSFQKGRVLRELADVERQRGLLPEAEAHLRQALAIHEKLPPDNDVELSHTLNNLSLILQVKGDLAQAELDSRRAVAISRKYPVQYAQTLTMMSNLGSVLFDEGKIADAEAILRNVLNERRRVLGEKHPQVATSMTRLARVLGAEGQYQEAEQLFRAGVARDLADLGGKHIETLNARANLAGVLVDEGAFAEAESLYRETIQAGTQVFGEHSDMCGWYAGLGWTLFHEGNSAAAEGQIQHGLAICRSRIGPGSIREARALEKYSPVEAALGHYDSAQSAIDSAQAIYRAKVPAFHSGSPDLIFQQAQLDWKRARNSQADSLFRQTLDIDRADGAPARLRTADHLLGYAGFLAATGAPSRAEPLAREAVAIRERDLPAGFWTIDTAKSSLGGVLTALGRYSDAEPLLVAAYGNLDRKLGLRAPDSQSARDRLVRLYEAWGKPRQAQSYRAARPSPGGAL